jgi:hypothetical protein
MQEFVAQWGVVYAESHLPTNTRHMSAQDTSRWNMQVTDKVDAGTHQGSQQVQHGTVFVQAGCHVC